jgi:hypothetical protein
MARQILIVIGSALLSIGGTGIIVALVWLTASKLHGTLPYLLDERAETLLYVLPALMLVVAIIGAGFVAGALSPPTKDRRIEPHPRTHSHA